MEMIMERPVEALQKQLVLFVFDVKRQGYNILTAADQDRFNLCAGSPKEAARELLMPAGSRLNEEDFHVFRPFTIGVVEYYPVQFDLWLTPQECRQKLEAAGFIFVSMLHHRFADRLRMRSLI